MNVTKKMVLILVASLLVGTGLAACDNRRDTPGERLDDALDKTGDKVKEAGEAIKTR